MWLILNISKLILKIHCTFSITFTFHIQWLSPWSYMRLEPIEHLFKLYITWEHGNSTEGLCEQSSGWFYTPKKVKEKVRKITSTKFHHSDHFSFFFTASSIHSHPGCTNGERQRRRPKSPITTKWRKVQTLAIHLSSALAISCCYERPPTWRYNNTSCHPWNCKIISK